MPAKLYLARTLPDGSPGRECSKCKNTLPLSNFRKEKGKYQNHCADCVRRYHREAYRKTQGISSHDAHLKSTYGISRVQYESMFAAQNGTCAICGKVENRTYRGKIKSMAVDHNHETGQVRALLCGGCNTAIGQLQDSPMLLRRAADYIEFHRDFTVEFPESKSKK